MTSTSIPTLPIIYTPGSNVECIKSYLWGSVDKAKRTIWGYDSRGGRLRNAVPLDPPLPPPTYVKELEGDPRHYGVF